MAYMRVPCSQLVGGYGWVELGFGVGEDRLVSP